MIAGTISIIFELFVPDFRMDVMINFGSPSQEAPKIAPFLPHENPESHKADLLHFHAAVSLNAPQKIWASPRRETVPARSVPEEAEHLAHGFVEC